ncbi:MAG: sodium:proton antiporter [Phycisphaerales bacterium JB063]
MTFILAICVAVTFGVSIYLMLGRELKGIAMGVFLLGHAANLSIIAMSGSPVRPTPDQAHADPTLAAELLPVAVKDPPVLADHEPLTQPLAQMVDPLPQALILTAIVIGFGVMAFLLTLIVVTSRTAQTIEINDLANEPGQPAPDQGNAQG